MWTLVLFDLPTATGLMRRVYSKFRKNLLRMGFEMFQKSVYLRWEDSDNEVETLRRRVMVILPAGSLRPVPVRFPPLPEQALRHCVPHR